MAEFFRKGSFIKGSARVLNAIFNILCLIYALPWSLSLYFVTSIDLKRGLFFFQFSWLTPYLGIFTAIGFCANISLLCSVLYLLYDDVVMVYLIGIFTWGATVCILWIAHFIFVIITKKEESVILHYSFIVLGIYFSSKSHQNQVMWILHFVAILPASIISVIIWYSTNESYTLKCFDGIQNEDSLFCSISMDQCCEIESAYSNFIAFLGVLGGTGFAVYNGLVLLAKFLLLGTHIQADLVHFNKHTSKETSERFQKMKSELEELRDAARWLATNVNELTVRLQLHGSPENHDNMHESINQHQESTLVHATTKEANIELENKDSFSSTPTFKSPSVFLVEHGSLPFDLYTPPAASRSISKNSDDNLV